MTDKIWKSYPERRFPKVKHDFHKDLYLHAKRLDRHLRMILKKLLSFYRLTDFDFDPAIQSRIWEHQIKNLPGSQSGPIAVLPP